MNTDNPIGPAPVTVTPKPQLKSRTLYLVVGSVALSALAAPELVQWLGGILGVRIAAVIVGAIALAVRQWSNAPLVGSPGEAKARADE